MQGTDQQPLKNAIRGTYSLVRLAQSRNPGHTKPVTKFVIGSTPPARIVGLSYSDNSVFRCGRVENNHLRLPDC